MGKTFKRSKTDDSDFLKRSKGEWYSKNDLQRARNKYSKLKKRRQLERERKEYVEEDETH